MKITQKTNVTRATPEANVEFESKSQLRPWKNLRAEMTLKNMRICLDIYYPQDCASYEMPLLR